jgi:hypothetical protein
MKNAFKLIGIIALAAVIGFSFFSCAEPDSGPTQTVTQPPQIVIADPFAKIDLSAAVEFTLTPAQIKSGAVIIYAASEKLIGCSSISATGVVTAPKFDDEVEFTIWDVTDPAAPELYKGDDETGIDFKIYAIVPPFNVSDLAAISGDIGDVKVYFIRGNGAGEADDNS